MRVVGLHHAQISIPTGAVEKAREFYCGLFGLPEIPKPDALLGRGGFWVNAGDHEVHFDIEDRPENFLSKAHLAYEVDNLSDWRTAMEQAGFELVDRTPI